MSTGRDPIIEVHGELTRCSNYVRKQKTKRQWEKRQKEIKENRKKEREEQLRQEQLQRERIREARLKEKREKLLEKANREKQKRFQKERQENKQTSLTKSEKSTALKKITDKGRLDWDRILTVTVIALLLFPGAPLGVFMGIVNWGKSFNSVMLKGKIK